MYNLTGKPVLDTKQIRKILPHRYPFLMVDKIIEMDEQKIVAVKNVTINEPFFQGHFPDNPVFPGVMQIEAMAQAGGVLAISQQEDNEKWDTYFLRIDEAKFKDMVVPGDTLIITMELLMPMRRGICKMKGEAYVGDKLVSEGVFAAKIVKIEE